MARVSGSVDYPDGLTANRDMVGNDCLEGAECRQNGFMNKCFFDDRIACTTDANCATSTWNPPFVSYNDFCYTALAKIATRQCRYRQSRCYDNSQCPPFDADGDATNEPDDCLPARYTHSRFAAAKDVVAQIVTTYHKLVNFGLMTFAQNTRTGGQYDYYPYYRVAAASVIPKTVPVFVPRSKLETAGCYAAGTVPAAMCPMDGVIYSLRVSPNSRYAVRTGTHSYEDFDMDFCGDFCPVPGTGTGAYAGSHYEFVTDWAPGDSGADPARDHDSTPDRVEATYKGKVITAGADKFVYFSPLPNELDDWRGVPIEGSGCGPTSACSASCGARWDADLAPFLDTSDSPATSKGNALAIARTMISGSYGGLFKYGNTPTGCSLKNDGVGASSTPERHSAFHYMDKVVQNDSHPCRRNAVVVLTDGDPWGPGDRFEKDPACSGAACANCSAPECATASLAGCSCRATAAAKSLLNDIKKPPATGATVPVKTYVIGYSATTASGSRRAAVNNLAIAGGTGAAYFSTSRQALRNALTDAVFREMAGSFATSPPVAAAAAETDAGIQLGTVLFDARVDFPAWRGHLVAYDMAGTPLWNATTVSFDATADPDFWKRRNVWTSDGASMVKIQVDATGAVVNKAQLRGLGLGVTDNEAELVARWILGDKKANNPAVLGALINSTPIDIGPPGKNPLPGGQRFHEANLGRPYLVYVGSSDGMLHAFFSKAMGATPAGKEAFAYIPQTMLPALRNLFAQSGQLADPRQHVFGPASSPKVKDLCVSSCNDATLAVWQTVLVTGDGWGGPNVFALDITSPADAMGVIRSNPGDPPVRLKWHTATAIAPADRPTYRDNLGLSTSVPAFTFAKTPSLDDTRVMFASAYGDGGGVAKGKVLFNASATTGRILDSDTVSPSNNCLPREHVLFGDIATAKNYAVTEQGKLMAAYFGDTWGNLWRYTPDVASDGSIKPSGAVSLVQQIGCDHPLHFSPAVVQLDRSDPASPHAGKIFLVSVTNSPLDAETDSLPASKIVVRKELAAGGSVVPDTGFGTSGVIELSAGNPSQVCGETDASGSCATALPAAARPIATPLVVLKADGSGFQFLTSWYVPSATGCDKGASYLTLHELAAATGEVSLKNALPLVSEPVYGVTFVGLRLYYTSQSGVFEFTGNLGQTFAAGGWQSGGGATASATRFRRLSWRELP